MILCLFVRAIVWLLRPLQPPAEMQARDYSAALERVANATRAEALGRHIHHELYSDSPAATAAAAGDSPAGTSDAETPAAAPPAGRYYFSYYPSEVSLLVADAPAPFVDPAIAAMIGARAAQALLDATVRPR